MNWQGRVLLIPAAAAACNPGKHDAPIPEVAGTNVSRTANIRCCEPWQPSDPCTKRRRGALGTPPAFDGVQHERAIFEDDDRMDLYCLDRPNMGVDDAPRIRSSSAAAVAIFSKDTLASTSSAEHFTLASSPTLAKNHGFCHDEIFAHQPLAARCSGVLLTNGRILTVEHCVMNLEWVNGEPVTLADLRFVFGFSLDDPPEPQQDGRTPFRLMVCEAKAGTTPTLFGKDKKAALVELELDCPAVMAGIGVEVAERAPLKDDLVYAIGYPRSLPAKFSGWGQVTVPGDLMNARLDTAPGNSGSPVFDANHQVVGVINAHGAWDDCSGHHNGSPCKRWERCIKCSLPLKIYSVHPTDLQNAVIHSKQETRP